MPFDSNGNFSLVSGYLGVTGQTILTSQHNPPLEDIAAGLSATLLRSGVAAMTGNLAMGGFKITGLANGTLATDAVTKAQLDAISVTVPDASTTVKGIVELATDAEAQTGTDTARAITPANLQAVTATTTRKGVSEFATLAEYRVGTDTGRSLVVDQVWSAAAEVTLTDAATIAVDMSTFINAKVTLGGNRTLGNPTNTKVGQSGVIAILQDATGSRTMAFSSSWRFAGGVDPVLTTTPAAYDLLFYYVRDSSFIYANLAKLVF